MGDDPEAALLAEIDADPEDPDRYRVYADWLITRGDPRGELMAAQIALSVAAPGERGALQQRIEAIFAAHDRLLPGVDPDHATARWRWGFLDSVRFDNREDFMDDDFDMTPTVRTLFALPQAQRVREVRVGVIRWDDQEEDVPKLIEELAALRVGERLRSLCLGDIDDDIQLSHHPLGDLAQLGASLPELRALSLRGCEFALGDLALPHLETIHIETCGLTRDNLASVLAIRSHELRSATIWFGSEMYGAEADPDDLGPLLEGDRWPALRHLGLANAEFTAELCERLPTAPILAQLRSLDLSMGTLDDEGVEPLIEAREAFAHLERIDLEGNFLSEAAVRALREAHGDRIVCDGQRPVGDGNVFVAVWE